MSHALDPPRLLAFNRYVPARDGLDGQSAAFQMLDGSPSTPHRTKRKHLPDIDAEQGKPKEHVSGPVEWVSAVADAAATYVRPSVRPSVRLPAQRKRTTTSPPCLAPRSLVTTYQPQAHHHRPPAAVAGAAPVPHRRRLVRPRERTSSHTALPRPHLRAHGSSAHLSGAATIH